MKKIRALQADYPARAAIFLSGSGTNAERILEEWLRRDRSDFDVVALVTDRPEQSRGRELSRQFGVDLVENDIRAFYLDRGLKRISIATPEAQAAREAWTDALRRQLAPYKVGFGLLAGFAPLSNITGDFSCLNVHPGDLTYLKEGRRYLVGLHTVPIERAILEGLTFLRTSVIIAEPYTGKGEEMDSGPILGISDKVTIDLQGHTLESLRDCAANRPASRPAKGYADTLEAVASYNQDKLKVQGDWVVFPRVVLDFALGRFGQDDAGQLHYRPDDREWIAVQTVDYTGMKPMPVI